MSTVSEQLARAEPLHRAGRLDEAKRIYQDILVADPANPDALNLLGAILAAEGASEDAARLIGRAVEARPDRADYRNNLGIALQDLGRFEEAQKAFEAAFAGEPPLADAGFNLANLQRHLGEADAARVTYDKVLAVAPDHARAAINLGNLLAEQGDGAKAIAAYARAAGSGASAADSARAYVNMGNVMRRHGDADAAIAAYDKALALEPHDGLAIKRALTLPVVTRSWDHIDAVRRDFRARVGALAKTDLHVTDPGLETSTTTFFLAYHAQPDRDLQQAVAALHLKACPELAYTAPHCARGPRRDGRLRVGMASAYFRTHSVGRLTHAFVAGLDRGRFEVVVFTVPGSDGDPLADEIRASADKVIVLPDDLAAARDAIAAEELDVLFYPEIGMDVRTYFLAFARLAPVQCVSWGHPDTTGIPNLDYFISSALLEPDGADDAYSERLVRLATLPTCYRRPEVPAPADVGAFGLDASRHIYLCPQSAIKMHPDVDIVLGGILEADPNGIVVLVAGAVADWTDQILARMDETIPGARDRIVVVPRQPPDDYLRLMSAADVILDTPHFSGGNTSYEAFALGKPVVTHDGAFMRGRVTAALYRMMGIEEGIAGSLEDYVGIAVRLGTEPGFRDDVAARITAARDGLFDQTEAIRELERFFLSAAGR